MHGWCWYWATKSLKVDNFQIILLYYHNWVDQKKGVLSCGIITYSLALADKQVLNQLMIILDAPATVEKIRLNAGVDPTQFVFWWKGINCIVCVQGYSA